ncbi:hypothetical protein HUU39_06655 [candidate division KSB1 bacterium]|nr:hypothetical protein [bacterium]NUM64942.1 hypothetical protein [candidate division KSB1 bacterium]
MSELQDSLPEANHRKAQEIAQKERLSLQQLLVNSVSNEIIRYETMNFFAARAKDFNEADFLAALQESPEVEPEEKDKLEHETKR